jgi:hypothetical protein
VILFGLLLLAGAAGTGGYLCWENRDIVVRVHVFSHVWHGHLYAVFVFGALLSCWFLLGASFVQCRLAERRDHRAAARARVAEPQSARVGRRQLRRSTA